MSGGDAGVVHPAGLGVLGVGQHRVGEPHLGFGERLGIRAGLDLRQRIVGRIEAVGLDAGQIGGGRLGAVAHRAVGDPERREVAAGIERLDRGALLLAAEEAVELAGGDLILELFGYGAVGRAGPGGSCRSRGPKGSLLAAAALALVSLGGVASELAGAGAAAVCVLAVSLPDWARAPPVAVSARAAASAVPASR